MREEMERGQKVQEKDRTHMRCEAMVPCISSRWTIHFVLLAEEPTRRLHSTGIEELTLKRRTITLKMKDERDWWRSREWEKIEQVPHAKPPESEERERVPALSHSLFGVCRNSNCLRMM